MTRKVLAFRSSGGNFVGEYKSIVEAHLETKVDRSEITKCCKRKIRQSNGYTFRYKESFEK